MQAPPPPNGRRASRPPLFDAVLLAVAAAALIATARSVVLLLARGVDGLGFERLVATAVEAGRELGPALLLCGVLVLAGRAMGRWRNGLRYAPLAAAIYALLVWEFVTLRAPAASVFAPDLDSARGIAANVGVAAFALGLAAVLLVSRLLPGTLTRAVRGVQAVGLVLFVVALAAFARTQLAANRDARPNVLLVSIDTLRPDHLASYGYGRATAPALDAFASQALRFDWAYTNHPWTLTAHATMLTGMLPSAHGVHRDSGLDLRAPTVASLLRDEGYRTFAVVDDNDWLHPRFGYARGFERYERVSAAAPTKVAELLASIDDNEAVGGDPFFAFAHFYDVHSDWQQLPYESAKADHARYAGWYEGDWTGCDPELGCASTLLSNMNQRGLELEGDELTYLRDLYDAGIATFDRALGELFEGLRERELLDKTIVIVTSDHGEEFFEHGRGLHDQHYNECLQVPLFVRVPGGRTGATDALVELADLAPTILAAAGVDPASVDSLQGRSLLPLVTGEPEELPESPGILMDPGSGAFGYRDRDYAVIRYKRDWYVFDRNADPLEQHELFDSGTLDEATMGALRQRLMARRDATLAIGEAYGERIDLAPQSAEAQAAMADLGYVDVPGADHAEAGGDEPLEPDF